MLNNYELFNLSDVGRRREKNEDYYATYQNKEWLLMILCDGMGGVKGGQVASRLAVKAIGEYFKKKFEEPVSFFQKSVAVANKAVKRKAQSDPELSQMGTTLVALLYNGSEVYYAHVGDSRLYLLRNGVLKQLTSDHSYVNEMVKRGLIKPDEAQSHQMKNRITRCIGLLESEPEICPAPLRVQEGDIFLLCSDGLTDMVTTETIRKIITKAPSIETAGEELIKEANLNGGKDNITVQLLKVTSNPVNGVRLNGSSATSQTRQKPGTKIFLLPIPVILLALLLWFFMSASLRDKLNLNTPSNHNEEQFNTNEPGSPDFFRLSPNARANFPPPLLLMPPDRDVPESGVISDSIYNYYYPKGEVIFKYPERDTLVKIISRGKPPLPKLKNLRLKGGCEKLSQLSIYPIRVKQDTVFLALATDKTISDSLFTEDPIISKVLSPDSQFIGPQDTLKLILHKESGSQVLADTLKEKSAEGSKNENHLRHL